MRKSKTGIIFTNRNMDIRVHIGETLLKLMEREEFSKISITKLSRFANVSRMTFYKYYTNKEDVLEDFVYEAIVDIIKDNQIKNINSTEIILKGFKKYERNILTIMENNLGYLINLSINNYVIENQEKKYIASFILGGIYSIYNTWLNDRLNFKSLIEEIKDLT